MNWIFLIFLTQNTQNYMNDEPPRLGQLVLRYPCALSKILGVLWLRIVKKGMKKARIATLEKPQSLKSVVFNLEFPLKNVDF